MVLNASSLKAKHLRNNYFAYFLILLIVIIGFFAEYSIKENEYNSALNQLYNIQMNATADVERWQSSYTHEVISLSSDPVVVAIAVALSEQQTALTRDLQDRFSARFTPELMQQNFLAVALLNQQGDILLKMPDSTIELEVSPVHLPREDIATNTHQPVSITPIQRTDISSRVGSPTTVATVKFVTPIYSSSGYINAYLALQVNVSDPLTSVMLRNKFAVTGNTYFFNDRGEFVSDSRFKRQLVAFDLLSPDQDTLFNMRVLDPGFSLAANHFAPKRYSEQPLTEMARSAINHEADTNLLGYRDYRGELVIGTWQWLDDLGIGVATELEKKEAFARLRWARWLIAVCCIIAITVSLLFPVMLRRKQRAFETQIDYLNSIMESSGDGIIVINTQSEIELINPHCAKMFGYERQELIGKKVDIFLPSHERDVHRTLVSTSTVASSRRIAGDRLLFGIAKTGVAIPVELNVNALHINGERKFVGLVKDISQRLANEKEIKRFKAGLDDALDCVFMFDPDTLKFTYINRGAMEQIGYSYQELMAMTPVDIKPSIDEPEFRQMISRIITSRTKQRTFQTVHQHKDGSQIPVEISLQYIDFEDITPLFIAFVRDITERLDSQQQLEQRESMLQNVLDSSIASILLLNESGEIVEVNETWIGLSRQFGSQRINWQNEAFIDIISQWSAIKLSNHDLDNLSDKLDEILQGGLNQWQHQFEVSYASTRHFFKLYATQVLNVPNLRCVIKLFDVTEFVETQQKLEQYSREAISANQAKSRFLATMSHEIRTPMNGIIGIIDLLSQSELSKEQLDMLVTVRNSSFALLNIINDILDLTKIESGSLQLDKTRFSLPDLLDSIGDLLWLQANENRVGLVLEPALNAPEYFIGDPIRLRQICLNLVSNAIKFSINKQKRGEVVIGYHVESANAGTGASASAGAGAGSGEQIVITVKDNGIGIPEHYKEQLFQPFSQADTSSTREFGGSGLGLNICHHLVTKMNGSIEVDSEVNQGSTFTVRIPLPVDNENNTTSTVDLSDVQVAIVTTDTHHRLLEQVERVVMQQKGSVTHASLPELTASFHSAKYQVIVVPPNVSVPADLDSLTKSGSASKVLMLTDDISQAKTFYAHNVLTIAAHPLKVREFLLALNQLVRGGEKLNSQSRGLLSTPLESQEKSPQVSPTANKILVAEDHPINRKVIVSQLHTLGYQCDVAEDGLMAYEYWRKGNYSLLLTDCNMPHWDAFELTAKIREYESQMSYAEAIPIIAVTANALTGDAERCLAAGMNGYLAKPVELQLLKQTLQSWIPKDSNVQTSMTVHCPFDIDQLKTLFGIDDDNAIFELLMDYSSNAEHDYENIQQGLQSKNMAQLGAAVHAAKGAAQSACAKELAGALITLEKRVHDGDWITINRAYEEVDTKFVDVFTWFKSNQPQIYQP